MEKKWSWRRAEVSSSQKGYSKFSIVINAEKVASRTYYGLGYMYVLFNSITESVITREVMATKSTQEI